MIILGIDDCTSSFLGDIYDYMGQRIEVTEVSLILVISVLRPRLFTRVTASFPDLSYQHTQTVDFSFNALADPHFTFHDHALVEAVKLENPEVHAFFRLLALCHTVMAEEKKEGEQINYPQVWHIALFNK